jgi:TolB-like protein/Flp pilus assembly protein TadD
MEQGQSFLSAVLTELNRRKVLRTVGAYAVAVFVVLQLMDAAVEPLRLPDWLPTLVVIVLILGFPLVFILAWVLEITPEGIKKTHTTPLLTGTQNTLLFSLMMLGMVGLGYGFYGYYSNVFTNGAATEPVPLVSQQREFVAPENSIAVLPFSDLSEDGSQGYFSDGIAEEILNVLAMVDGLHVAARTSSFAFRQPNKDIREIGRLLNVSTVLEGSIRKAGDRIRLTAQLINVEDGYHIWSHSYDRELDDVFAIQDEVASAIATALVDSFEGLEQKPASRTRDLAAFEAYRTGRLHWWRRSPDELQKAITLFAGALEHDPSYAPAYAALADSWLLLAMYGNLTNMKATERAMPMIEKALEIDPESSEAFAALGLARWQIGQRDAAESALRQALKLNDDYIPAYLWLGGLLGELGRLPEQNQVLQQAMAIDPLNELLAINFAGNLASRGDYEAAIDLLKGLISLRPDSATLLRIISGHAMQFGDLVAAWRYASQSYELEPESPVVIEVLAKAWANLGAMERAERLLLDGLEIANENRGLRMDYFFLLLEQGRLEKAERLLIEQYGNSLADLPEQLQRWYYFQKGLVSLVAGDREAAAALLEQAIVDDYEQSLYGEQILYVTLSSALQFHLGNTELAERRLASAERAVRRARINGLDNADIFYTESSIHALRGDSRAALASLQSAYERGFRNTWFLEFDLRLDSLREEPGFVAIKEQIAKDIAEARTEVESFAVASYWAPVDIRLGPGGGLDTGKPGRITNPATD